MMSFGSVRQKAFLFSVVCIGKYRGLRRPNPMKGIGRFLFFNAYIEKHSDEYAEIIGR
jgi:hypothetical protein